MAPKPGDKRPADDDGRPPPAKKVRGRAAWLVFMDTHVDYYIEQEGYEGGPQKIYNEVGKADKELLRKPQLQVYIDAGKNGTSLPKGPPPVMAPRTSAARTSAAPTSVASGAKKKRGAAGRGKKNLSPSESGTGSTGASSQGTQPQAGPVAGATASPASWEEPTDGGQADAGTNNGGAEGSSQRPQAQADTNTDVIGTASIIGIPPQAKKKLVDKRLAHVQAQGKPPSTAAKEGTGSRKASASDSSQQEVQQERPRFGGKSVYGVALPEVINRLLPQLIDAADHPTQGGKSVEQANRLGTAQRERGGVTSPVDEEEGIEEQRSEEDGSEEEGNGEEGSEDGEPSSSDGESSDGGGGGGDGPGDDSDGSDSVDEEKGDDDDEEEEEEDDSDGYGDSSDDEDHGDKDDNSSPSDSATDNSSEDVSGEEAADNNVDNEEDENDDVNEPLQQESQGPASEQQTIKYTTDNDNNWRWNDPGDYV